MRRVWRRWRFRLRHPRTWRALEAHRFDAILREHYLPIITANIFEQSPLLFRLKNR